MSLSDGGDQDDKDGFKQLCDKLNIDPNITRLDAEDMWKKAQDSVIQDLEDPKCLAMIEKRAWSLGLCQVCRRSGGA
jgi:hypothetical protein